MPIAMPLLLLAAPLLLLPAASLDLAYHHQTYSSMSDSLTRLAATYPHLSSLSVSQSLYGLPSVGTCGGNSPCENIFLTIQDAVRSQSRPSSVPDALEGPEFLPDVFFSGEVHGDEQVGPVSLLAASELLLVASSCAGSYFAGLTNTPSCTLWFNTWSYTLPQLCPDSQRNHA